MVVDILATWLFLNFGGIHSLGGCGEEVFRT